MISITFKYRVVTFPYKMRISESTYKKFESIIHPKLKANIHEFKKDGYYFFPSSTTAENEIEMEQIRK